jgi:hypothetical protein
MCNKEAFLLSHPARRPRSTPRPRHGYPSWEGSSQVLRTCCWRLLHVRSQPFACFRLDMSTYARSFALELCRARLSLLGTGVDLAMQSCLIQMFILFCLCCRDSQRAGRRCGHHEPPGPGPLLLRKEVDGRRDYRTASTEDGLDGSAAITGLLLLYPYF